jgi:hypothetical protein
MKKPLLVLTAAVALAATASPALAHHSFAATYFVDKSVTVDGTVAQFLFRNPHSFIQVETKDATGTVVRWAAEWAAGTALNSQGVERDALKAGDHVIVSGNPGRNAADHRMRLTSIVRPSDGWKWSGTFQ